MTRSHPSHERGVTLAEILVAAAIVSVGLVALATVIPLSSAAIHEGNALSTATFLAEQRLEEIRSAAWTTTPSTNDCLGTGSTSAPSSTTCTRISPIPCAASTPCTTWPDESAVPGHAGYRREVRIWDCTATVPPDTTPGCGGIAHPDARLVRVSVAYAPLAAVAGTRAPSSKTATIQMMVTRRR